MLVLGIVSEREVLAELRILLLLTLLLSALIFGGILALDDELPILGALVVGVLVVGVLDVERVLELGVVLLNRGVLALDDELPILGALVVGILVVGVLDVERVLELRENAEGA